MDPITQQAPPLASRAVLAQSWCDLVFAHWRVPSSIVAPLLPAGIVPDEFDGSSWVGLIPFRMRRTTVAGSPVIPYFGSFVEVNVRLYGVDPGGRRGVVFRSLEANRLASVLVARAALSLPYFWSTASMQTNGRLLTYRSERHGSGSPRSSIAVETTREAVDGDPLAEFLTARWTLFVSRGGVTRTMHNEHEPWPLFRAELVHLDDDLVSAAGLAGIASRQPDSLLWSPGVRTSFAAPEARSPRQSG
jgi:uncharacterized protein YqjF (DUF2071 family)